jgi:hypothetical protein
VATKNLPPILLPSSSQFLAIDTSLPDDITSKFLDNIQQPRSLFLPESITKQYIGGASKYAEHNIQDWIELENSTFRVVKSPSIRANNKPKTVKENLWFSNQNEYTNMQKELKTLRPIIPQKIQMRTEQFPLFFKFGFSNWFFQVEFLDRYERLLKKSIARTKCFTSVNVKSD